MKPGGLGAHWLDLPIWPQTPIPGSRTSQPQGDGHSPKHWMAILQCFLSKFQPRMPRRTPLSRAFCQKRRFFAGRGKWDLLGRSNRRRGPPGAIRQMARVAFLSGGFASASVPQRFAHLGAFRWGQWIGRGTSDL